MRLVTSDATPIPSIVAVTPTNALNANVPAAKPIAVAIDVAMAVKIAMASSPSQYIQMMFS
jgi:hypothetical protein